MREIEDNMSRKDFVIELDVSGLTTTQIDILAKLYQEFNRLNDK